MIAYWKDEKNNNPIKLVYTTKVKASSSNKRNDVLIKRRSDSLDDVVRKDEKCDVNSNDVGKKAISEITKVANLSEKLFAFPFEDSSKNMSDNPEAKTTGEEKVSTNTKKPLLTSSPDADDLLRKSKHIVQETEKLFEPVAKEVEKHSDHVIKGVEKPADVIAQESPKRVDGVAQELPKPVEDVTQELKKRVDAVAQKEQKKISGASSKDEPPIIAVPPVFDNLDTETLKSASTIRSKRAIKRSVRKTRRGKSKRTKLRKSKEMVFDEQHGEAPCNNNYMLFWGLLATAIIGATLVYRSRK
uniref:LPXTG cell wall anchor domain-containing protein n=1 Tax=Rhabditophanes sp. KR3021 TaxID=114890 RepID=A0AC35UHG1_9BILA